MTDQTNSHEVEKPIQLDEIGITRINLRTPARRLAEVMDEIAPTGEKVHLRDFIDKEITVHSIRPFQSQYGVAVYVIFTSAEGELFNMVVSNRIVLPKLATIRDSLPVTCTVVKKEGGRFGEYFDIK